MGKNYGSKGSQGNWNGPYSQYGYGYQNWGGRNNWGGKGSSSATGLGSLASSFGNMMGEISALGQMAQVGSILATNGLGVSQQSPAVPQPGITLPHTTVATAGAEPVSKDPIFQKLEDAVDKISSKFHLTKDNGDKEPGFEKGEREFEQMMLRSAAFKAMQKDVDKVQKDVADVSTSVENLETGK